MRCSDIEKTLDGYDMLDPRTRAAVDAHMAGCIACRGQLEKVQHMQRLIQTAAGYRPEPDNALFLTERIMDAVKQRQAGRTSIVAWFTMRGMPVLRVAYAVISVLLVAAFVYETGRPAITVVNDHAVVLAPAPLDVPLNTTAFLKQLEKPHAPSPLLSIVQCVRICQATERSVVCDDCKKQFSRLYGKL